MLFYNRKVNILTKAIQDKSIIQFKFQGKSRIVEPYIIGVRKNSYNNILYAWFLDGYSKSGFKNPNIRWRIYPIRKMKNIEITDEPFKGHRKISQFEENCFKNIIVRIEDNVEV